MLRHDHHAVRKDGTEGHNCEYITILSSYVRTVACSVPNPSRRYPVGTQDGMNSAALSQKSMQTDDQWEC